jgi:hypothetical protein
MQELKSILRLRGGLAKRSPAARTTNHLLETLTTTTTRRNRIVPKGLFGIARLLKLGKCR